MLPPGSCDAHCHVFGPFDRFPLPLDRSFTPPEAPVEVLRRMHESLGIQRAVIVHSLGQGMDHRPLLEALASSPGRYRGVAVLGAQTTSADLAALDAAGVRGVRFSFMPHLGGPPCLAEVTAKIAMVRPFGWHVAVHVTGSALLKYEQFFAGLEVPLVIDHMARPDLLREADACRMSLNRLIDGGRVWIKLSAPERLSRSGPPYDDVVDYARALHCHAPDRMLWGTDWPHVNLSQPPPDERVLLQFLRTVVRTPEALRQVLVETPAKLFSF